MVCFGQAPKAGLRSLRLCLPDVKPVAESCGCQFVILWGLMAFPSEDMYSLVCSGINETGLLVLRMIDRDLRHPQNACNQLIGLETPPSEEWYHVPETFVFFCLLMYRVLAVIWAVPDDRAGGRVSTDLVSESWRHDVISMIPSNWGLGCSWRSLSARVYVEVFHMIFLVCLCVFNLCMYTLHFQKWVHG